MSGRSWQVFLALLVGGCSQPLISDSSGPDPSTGTDHGTGGTGGTGVDTGDTGGSDSATEPPLTYCDDLLSTAPPSGLGGFGACLSGEIFPGDTIIATNDGGSTHYNRPMYEDWFCASTESVTAHYDAPERVYYFAQPPHSRCTFTLDKTCNRNLEMRLLMHMESDTCPVQGDNLVNCERDSSATVWENQVKSVDAAQNGMFYDVVIDGRNGAIDNFKLTVTCVL